MFAYVKNGQVMRTWGSIPNAIENVSALPLMPEAEWNAHGFYRVIDKRPAKPTTTYSYSDDVVTWDGSKPVRTATLVDPPAPTQDELDAAEAKAYAPLAALAAITPAQIQAYINANVTDLPSAKAAIKTLAVAVGILARRL